MVEIRPTNLNGRKILHHSIAHVVMDPNDPDLDASSTGHGPRRRPGADPADPAAAAAAAIARARRSWNGRSARATTATRTAPGKLLKPGERIGGISTCTPPAKPSRLARNSASGFYPKGQEPKHRTLPRWLHGPEEQHQLNQQAEERVLSTLSTVVKPAQYSDMVIQDYDDLNEPQSALYRALYERYEQEAAHPRYKLLFPTEEPTAIREAFSPDGVERKRVDMRIVAYMAPRIQAELARNEGRKEEATPPWRGTGRLRHAGTRRERQRGLATATADGGRKA